MLDQPTQCLNKQVPSRKEVFACLKASHAKSPNTLLPSPVNTDQPRQPLLVLIFSPTRNMKTLVLLLPTSESPLSTRRNMKLLIFQKMNSSLLLTTMVHWLNTLSSPRMMKMFITHLEDAGMKKEIVQSFSQFNQLVAKKRLFQEETKNDSSMSKFKYIYSLIAKQIWLILEEIMCWRVSSGVK